MKNFVYDNDNNTYSDGQSIYNIKLDSRGIREKLWLHDQDIIKQAKDYSNSNYMVKYNRNDNTCEVYGEILYYAFLKSCGANCTKYELAQLSQTVNGVEITHHGVICPTYKNNRNEFDFSGYDLFRYYNLSKIDNSGNLPINTIASYIKCVKSLGFADDEDTIRQIKRDLIKMTFFDYVTYQTDRHWENIAFILNSEKQENKNGSNVRVASSFDNGCCFLFKRKEVGLNTISNQLRVAKKHNDTLTYSAIIDQISNKCVSYLGIKTSMCSYSIDDYDIYQPRLKVSAVDNWEQIYLNELCYAISKDEELSQFFKDKELFKIDNARKVLESQGDTVPEPLMYLANELVNHRVNQVYKTLEKYTNSELSNSSNKGM